MKPYKPEKLPPAGIDWAAFVSLIGQYTDFVFHKIVFVKHKSGC